MQNISKDLNEIGKPKFWHLQTHIDAVIQMIRADEIMTALRMLDDIPAWHRANYPKELQDLKARIYRNTYDTIEYSSDQDEINYALKPEIGIDQWLGQYCYPRAQIITEIVKNHNSKGLTPFIVDVGSSHGNMPLGLMHLGLNFDYLGLAPNAKAASVLKNNLGHHWKDETNSYQHTILVCTEVLEHMTRPEDMVHTAHKYTQRIDEVVLSVPLGCLDGGLYEIDRRLGHVKGWNAKDLSDFANKHFPGFNWKHYLSHSQVIHGTK